jgi:sodium-dependent dicarboxylate transporter 2/3/5
MFIVSYIALCLFFPLKAETCLISKQETKTIPVKFEEKVAIFSLLIALTLWLLPSFTNLKIPLGTAAILAVVPLFLLRTLPWDKAKEIDWGTVILFGGGLTLGSVIEVSGITNSLNLGFQSEFIMLMVIVGICILLSEVGSNTASAAILIPLFYSIAPDSTILIALACSFGFMLPVSTPPNAIIYGTGKVPLRTMLKTGVVVDLLGVVLLASYFYFLAVPS